MKKETWILILISVFIVLIIFLNFYMNKIGPNSQMGLSKEESEIANKNSKVIEVTKENFEQEVMKSDKKVFIDFYAVWCMPCKQFSPIVESVANKREDIKFVKIDVDRETEIAEMFRIYSMPTSVIMQNGKEIDRNIGLLNEKQLISILGK